MLIGYDLGHYPITYDFVYWLVRAEEARIKAEVESLSLVFQPGSEDGFRLKTMRDYQLHEDRKQWRLHNLLSPVARLLPSVRTVTVTPVRLDISTPHFDLHTDIHKTPISPFRASDVARSMVRKMYPKRYVTITLRQSDVQMGRNSNRVEWRKVAVWLEKRGLEVVVVPDTEAVLQGIHHNVGDECVAAAMSQDIRLALYELSEFSLFTTGGPFALAWYADVNFAVFKLKNDEQTGEESRLRQIGLEDGASRGPYRNAYWCEDTFENIRARVEPYLQLRSKIAVPDVVSAQTHFRGHLIIEKNDQGCR